MKKFVAILSMVLFFGAFQASQAMPVKKHVKTEQCCKNGKCAKGKNCKCKNCSSKMKSKKAIH